MTFLVTISGITEVMLSVVLFIWTFFFIKQNSITTLDVASKDMVMFTMLTFGLCLLIFGSMTIHLVKRLRYLESTTIFFCLSQGVFWIGILILEIIYPVKMPFFCLHNVSPFIIIICILLIGMNFSVTSLFIYDKNH